MIRSNLLDATFFVSTLNEDNNLQEKIEATIDKLEGLGCFFRKEMTITPYNNGSESATLHLKSTNSILLEELRRELFAIFRDSQVHIVTRCKPAPYRFYGLRKFLHIDESVEMGKSAIAYWGRQIKKINLHVLTAIIYYLFFSILAFSGYLELISAKLS